MSKLQPSVAALVLTLALGGCTMTAEDQGTVDQVVEAPMSHAAVDYPDSIDPVLTAMTGKEVRIPNTTPAFRGQAMLHASALKTTPLGEVESLLGHRITSMHDPRSRTSSSRSMNCWERPSWPAPSPWRTRAPHRRLWTFSWARPRAASMTASRCSTTTAALLRPATSRTNTR